MGGKGEEKREKEEKGWHETVAREKKEKGATRLTAERRGGETRKRQGPTQPAAAQGKCQGRCNPDEDVKDWNPSDAMAAQTWEPGEQEVSIRRPARQSGEIQPRNRIVNRVQQSFLLHICSCAFMSR